jgi:hypothetical protein
VALTSGETTQCRAGRQSRAAPIPTRAQPARNPPNAGAPSARRSYDAPSGEQPRVAGQFVRDAAGAVASKVRDAAPTMRIAAE